MSAVLDVRNTDQAEAFVKEFQATTAKLSHFLACNRWLNSGRELPVGVDLIRPVL